ncbi:hypothetical protein [Agrobacterium tumefaciens]|uniref:hypothetical protein n=1 Tax=Agrobacterium tumefaciens TaxID=358 RepID=UPI0015738C28|nr:hypothetical protein [Agrobacterium tumefaciens]WCK05637.1 hypothetical protein G6L31_024150 [Agrobacterium tumefaciens]
MALHEPSSHWWSDIVETEFRLPQKRDHGDGTLPSHDPRIRFGLVSAMRRMTKLLLAKVRRFFAHRPRSEPSVSCIDPVEAYMHACIAATFFCHVSHEFYGLADTTGEQGASRRNHPSGEDS